MCLVKHIPFYPAPLYTDTHYNCVYIYCSKYIFFPIIYYKDNLSYLYDLQPVLRKRGNSWQPYIWSHLSIIKSIYDTDTVYTYKICLSIKQTTRHLHQLCKPFENKFFSFVRWYNNWLSFIYISVEIRYPKKN